MGLAGSCDMSKLKQYARKVLTHAAALAWNKHCCRTHVIMGQAAGMHTGLLHEVGHMCDMAPTTRRLQITCQMSRQPANNMRNWSNKGYGDVYWQLTWDTHHS